MAPTDRSIQPRLIPSAIREPAVSAADGNIENKVERYHIIEKRSVSFFLNNDFATHTLIERSGISAARPRVGKDDLLRGVRDGRWEFATLEERDVETQVEHVLKAVVDVNPTGLKR